MSSYDEVKSAYDTAKNILLTSPQRQEFTDFLKRTIHSLQTLNLDWALCIGLSPSSTPSPIDPLQRTADRMMQFLVFQYCKSILGRRKNGIYKKMIGFIYDDGFSDAEKDFVESKGFVILPYFYQEEDGYSYFQSVKGNLTTDTFVFIPFGIDTKRILDVLKMAHPALLISPPFHVAKDPNPFHALHAIPDSGGVLADSPPRFRDIEIAKRQISHPFLSARLFRPLLTYTKSPARRSDTLVLDPSVLLQNVHPATAWTAKMWIYWRPDHEDRLTQYMIGDDIECPCIYCWAKRDDMEDYNSRWRVASRVLDTSKMETEDTVIRSPVMRPDTPPSPSMSRPPDAIGG